MAIRTLQVLADDLPSSEPPEVYEVFEEAAPFLIYIHDFWIGRANCPLFAEHVLLTAASLSQGLPALDSSKFKRFLAIPIPFCLRFREGSAMMRLVPPRELDPFASLRGQGVLPVAPKTILPPKASNVIPLPPATRTPVVPPRALRRNREVESLKADASSFLSSPRSTRSRGSDNELLSENPALDIAPHASSSRKSRQIVATDEDEDEDEDSAPPPKHLKTTSSISASLPRRSVKRVSVSKQVTKAAVKPAPKHSSGSTFQPVLLADAQGRLRLPEQSTGNFTPFPKFTHARNSAAL
ncbi:hypothetical protein EV359DRAFT_88159, partial [Lentinula novae-zelandiae]